MRSKKNLILTPEDAASGTRIVQMLHGPNDPFWHRRIARLFAKVGIGTRRLERRTDQNLWLALLTQGSFNLSPNKKVASGQMGKVLRNGNLKVMFGRVNIVERSDDTLRVTFYLDIGSPGILRSWARSGKPIESWRPTEQVIQA